MKRDHVRDGLIFVIALSALIVLVVTIMLPIFMIFDVTIYDERGLALSRTQMFLEYAEMVVVAIVFIGGSWAVLRWKGGGKAD